MTTSNLGGQGGNPGRLSVWHLLAYLLVTGVAITGFFRIEQIDSARQNEVNERAGAICKVTQDNYDALTRVTATGVNEPLTIPPAPAPIDPNTVRWVVEILETANERAQVQQVEVNKAQGSRPVC